jgi:Zn-dependent M28 family amino/carboxypeptidase
VFRTSRSTVVAATLAATAALALPLSTTAVAGPAQSDSERLQERVTVDGVLAHLEDLQEIADANDGTRAAGLPGYDASSEYVAEQMRSAGYDVTLHPFEFDFFEETADPEFAQTSPDAVTYAEGDDFATMTFSGSGDVTAPTQGVDLALAAPETSTSGCEAADFAGFTAGNVALIQRGTCTFLQKASNAEAAGATAAVIFNQGNGEGRTGVVAGTLGEPGVGIPVIGTSFAIGQDLADPAGSAVHVFTATFTEPRTISNVIAETPRGNPNNVVMLGAHLDSVTEGPGINDNGSGSAALMEIAEQMAGLRTTNKVRFAWWGAEELGLVGSSEYVDSLSPAQRDRIALYLNFDMIGSPNYIRGVYDGDGSSFGSPGPAGSGAIEAHFNSYYEDLGLVFEATAFDGRSDYEAFIANGIPAGGLFTGADETKTPEQEATYGGVAGQILDPCYHQACDSFTPVRDGADGGVYAELRRENDLVGNVAPDVLDLNADAIADAVATYAADTSSVTGPQVAAAGAAGTPAQSAQLHGFVR